MCFNLPSSESASLEGCEGTFQQFDFAFCCACPFGVKANIGPRYCRPSFSHRALCQDLSKLRVRSEDTSVSIRRTSSLKSQLLVVASLNVLV